MSWDKCNTIQLLSGKGLRKTSRLVPIPFLLELIDSNELLLCEEILRIVPGKRIVAMGMWGEKEVVAKLFYSTRKANEHIERDKKGIDILVQSGISVPILYYQGTSKDKQIHILLFEKIRNVITQLPLEALTLELATQHVLGIHQTDLHLKNFLITTNKIYTLDGSDIEKFDHPLSKEMSLDSLALFISQLGVEAEKVSDHLLQVYANSRSWKIKENDSFILLKNIQKWRKMRWKKYQKKIFRNSSMFEKKRSLSALMMCDRASDKIMLKNLLRQPDDIFFNSTSQLLKNGRSTTVIKTTVNGQDWVIKRYNIKNIWHFLRRCLRPTRAAKSWRLSQYLMLMGIPTAKPIAFIEKQFLGLRGTSYFMMEPVKGMNVSDYFSQIYLNEEEKKQMVDKVIALINNLAKLKLTHGDLKATNILISNGEPILIDLDGMKEHSCPFGFERTFQLDLNRFLKNWHQRPDIYQLFEKGFRDAPTKEFLTFSSAMLQQQSID